MQPPLDIKPAKAPEHLADGVTGLRRLSAGLRLRCPICWRGPMFDHPLRMRVSCDDCSWQFDRGNGYFVGAMYFGYWLSVTFAGLVVLLLWLVGAPLTWWLPIVAVLVTAFGPLVAFPYSRLIWIWAEQKTLYWQPEDDATILFRHRSQAGIRPLRVVDSPASQQAEHRQSEPGPSDA